MEHEDRLFELKETIANQGKLLKHSSTNESLRRRCSDLILQGTQSLLLSWEKSSSIKPLPCGLIRQVFSLLLLELGPGDAQVRSWLLLTLCQLESTDGRQLLLDALPWFMTADIKQKEENTKIVLSVFRDVLVKDPKALLPIISCLSSLPLSENGRVEAWNVALASLPTVDEIDLPALVQSFLRNVTGVVDAAKALQAIREETHLLEKSDEANGMDQIPLVSLAILNSLLDRAKGRIICEAYIDILQKVTRQVCKEPMPSHNYNESLLPFTCVDMMVLLSLYLDSEFKSTIEAVIDSLVCNGAFPFPCIETVSTMIVQRHKFGEPISVLQERLLPSLQALVIFLLLAPIRINNLTITALGDTRDLILSLHRRQDRDRQEELLRCIFKLSDELSQVLSDGIYDQTRRLRIRNRRLLKQKQERLILTTEVIHEILVKISNKFPSTLSRFKNQLMERLTTESEVSIDATEKVSEILANLTEASSSGQAGIDSTDLMMLLQKLLFTSSFRQKNANLSPNDNDINIARIIRGFILAKQLIMRPSLSASDKECLYMWIQQLLHPSNRRTVHPLIGSLGLKFLLTWKQLHGDQEASLSLFSTVRMLVANTGLVQLLSHFLQHKKNETRTVRVYCKMPSFYLPPVSDVMNRVREKKRELVLCIDSFLRIRGISRPQCWLAELQWIFELVDTYLELGRNESRYTRNGHLHTIQPRKLTGWTPDGWLEASLELPALSLSLGNQVGDSEKFLSLFETFTFDLKNSHSRSTKDATKELIATLLKYDDGLELKSFLNGLLRFSCGVAFGAGLSIAILQNAHRHFESNADFDIKERKLTQYQLLKIFDLKKKLQLISAVLDVVSDELYRFAIAEPMCGHGKTKIFEYEGNFELSASVDADDDHAGERYRSPQLLQLKDDVDAGVKSVDTMNGFLFRSNTYRIGHDVLYRSLTQGHDDDTIDSFLHCKEPSSEASHSANLIIELRLHVLKQLHQMVEPKSLETALNTAITFVPSERTCSQIMQAASRLSLVLPKYRREHFNRGIEQELTQLAFLMAAYLLWCQDLLIQQQNTFLNAFAKHFVTSLDDTAKSAMYDGSEHRNVQEQTGQKLLFHLHICDDQLTANIFLDMLGVLSLQNSELVEHTTIACWRALHTVYTVQSQDDENHLPHVFLVVTDSLMRKNAYENTTAKLPTQALLAFIVRASSNSSKEYLENASTRNTLLILWALLTQPTCFEGGEFELLSKLTDELERFLFPNESRQGKEVKKAKVTFKSSLPGLSDSTLGFFFDMFLNLSVATFAITSPVNAENGEGRKEPYRKILTCLRLFSRLLDIFSVCSHRLPRRLGALMINSCHQVLNLCHFHIIGCVNWRNKQPLLTTAERKVGTHDAGSIHYIEDLLKEITASGVGRIMLFCEKIRTSSLTGRVATTIDGAHLETEKEIYSARLKRIAALLQSAERAMGRIRAVASAHNLVPPRVEYKQVSTAVSSGQGKSAKVDSNDKGFHEISWETLNDTPAKQAYSMKKKRRVSTLLMEKDVCNAEEKSWQMKTNGVQGATLLVESDDELLETGSDHQSRGDNFSDGFGVSGEWFDKKLSENDDDSLELESNSLFDVS